MGQPFFERVAVVGAGTMGNGISQTFATFGSRVELVDVDARALEKGLAAIDASLARVVKKGTLPEADARAARGRIAASSDLGSIRDVALVVEAVVERPDVKQKVFAALDAQCPAATILASNTSSISITEIAAA